MAVENLAPPPLRSRLVDKTGLMTREFNNWLRGLTSAVNASATQSVQPIVLSDLSAALGTSVLLPFAPAGVYRLSYTVRISQAATVSSSVTVRFHWFAGGLSQTFSAPALTTNSTTTPQSDAILVQVDPGTLISYSTLYDSVGATVMTYDLAVTCEALG
jgi:hypothetical protein